MRTMTMVLALAAVTAAALEAQAVASPSSRRLPRGQPRGIRTEPPPPAEPGQSNRPVQPSRGDHYHGAYGPAYLYYGAYGESPGTYVQQAPPPPLIDVRGPQPGPAMAFIPGTWNWTGSAFNWIEGRWVPIPAGYTHWVPGRWTANHLGHYYVRGYWEY